MCGSGSSPTSHGMTSPSETDFARLDMRPSAANPSASRGNKEHPYRASPGHDLFVYEGPNVEESIHESATAGGTCSCGWTKYAANRTALVLASNRHVEGS